MLICKNFKSGRPGHYAPGQASPDFRPGLARPDRAGKKCSGQAGPRAGLARAHL